MKHTMRETKFKIDEKKRARIAKCDKPDARRVSQRLQKAEISKEALAITKRVKLNIESTYENLKCGATLEMPKQACISSTPASPSVKACRSLLLGSTASLNEMSLNSQLSTSCSNFDEESVSLSCFAVAPHLDDQQISQEESSAISCNTSSSSSLRRCRTSSSRDNPIPSPSQPQTTVAVQSSVKSTPIVNSASFVPREHTRKWSHEETLLFYKGLELFGTDFSMISRLFTARSRKMCKNKFRKEEQMNSAEVEVRLNRNKDRRMKHVVTRIQALRESITLSNAASLTERINFLSTARRARFSSFNSIDSQDIVRTTISIQLHYTCIIFIILY